MSFWLRCPKCGGKVPLNAGVSSPRGIIVNICRGCGARFRSLAEERMLSKGILLIAVIVSIFLGGCPVWLALPISAVITWLFIRWAYTLEEVDE